MAETELTQSPYKELARRFLITFLIGVVVYRLGVLLPIPGIDVNALQRLIKDHSAGNGGLASLLRYANMFNGGAIGNASIFGLGITPYISASIIMQLLAFSIPGLKAMQKEGESGRRKINQYTRYATLLICIVQSGIAALAALHLQGNQVIVDSSMSGPMFVAQSVVVITTGCMLLLWLAEQITRYGIGNGVSIIITVGILSYLGPAFVGGEVSLQLILGAFLVAMLIIAAIVIVVQAVRRINLEQQRRVQGNKVYGGQQTTLPLKLNQANVIPVIFASPVMMVLAFAAQHYGSRWGLDQLFAFGEPGHRYMMAALIIAFTYFYISVTFDLFDLSNHFKQQGFFVRGVKPGKNTVDHLSSILKRITFVGACFLAAIAVMPELIGNSTFGLSGRGGNLLLGGTGLMIVVGVSLDVMQKVGSFFLAHRYGGLGGGDGGALGMRKPGKRF
jgi:preprotein translocase subunit SecY